MQGNWPGSMAKDPEKWEENVAFYILNKSKSEFYSDPVVKAGYCRGEEPVNYVREIIHRYDQYRQLIQMEAYSAELPS